jgi:ADP-ribose pyrophosphatase YjhB (NUDIX family)
MNISPPMIIAAGPVIIEDGKVLLNREKKDYGTSRWFFPGGKVEDLDASLEDACRREVQEEMGLAIEIIKPLRTLLHKKLQEDGEGHVILVHYLAKRIGEIAPGKEIAEWGWHDINNLPENCAPNVVEIIADITNDI